MSGVAYAILSPVAAAGVLFLFKTFGEWLAKAVSRDVHGTIATVVRAELEPFVAQLKALDVRDAAAHREVMARLTEVEKQNTADHGEVIKRLAAVEDRLAKVEDRLPAPSDIPKQTEENPS